MRTAALTQPVDARAQELHRRGVEALNRGRPVLGARHLRAGLRLLGWPSTGGSPVWPELIARLLSSLAAAETARGNSELGFELMDSADGLMTEENRGLLLVQRGLLLAMVGQVDDAVRCFDAAVPPLERSGEWAVLTRTLLNRAFIHQIAGKVRPALADLARSERISSELGMSVQVAKAHHGRGSCLLLIGDIPGALRAFELAEREYADNADGMLAVLAVEKARALLAAGLRADAAAELDAALPRFRGLGMDQEHAEAELTRAQIGLAIGDHARARRWAQGAERRFRRRHNEAWAAVAELTRLRAELAGKRPPLSLADRAARLAQRLRALRLDNDAESAALVAAGLQLSYGNVDEAAKHVRARPGSRSGLDTRLRRHLMLAGIATARADRAATFRHARTGLALLAEHRDHFGSVDLRTGVAALGVELARAGLEAALDDGRPATVFRWLERSRAQAFRSRAVFPRDDPHIADALAELRQRSGTRRASELAGRRDVASARRCAELERQIRARTWQVSGAGEQEPETSLAEIRAELADADATLVSFVTVGQRMRGFLVDGRVARLVELGDSALITEAVSRLRSDLDVLCGRSLLAALAATVRASAQRQLAILTEHLIAPLRRWLGDAELVVVPTGPLSGVPWALLPDLCGRPVTVTPSASVWLAARRRRSGGGRTLLVAGPNLKHATSEIVELSAIYPTGTALVDGEATVDQVVDALDGCGVAHFATHGHHEQDSVLFSRLDLVDGPLMAYDIHQLAVAPEHVVLSSCDVGRSVVRDGDELLGFTAALLYGGTRTVVASVARMDDQTAVGVMTAYHRELARRTPPARALAQAALTAPFTPLVCFGSS